MNNHLPIYLLDLKHMRLIHRTDIAAYLKADIQKYCLRDGISDSGDYSPAPAYVETLRSDAKTWIKDKTGYSIFSHRWGSNELTFSDISQFEKIAHGSDKSTDTIKSKFIPKKVTDLAKRRRQTPYAEFGLLEAMTALCDGEELNDDQGFVKIIQFFTQSRKYNCNLVWFDTGCIDKDSSSELEESIRSMFNWYRNSKICVIHLSQTSNTMNIRSDPWFTRGWTLQELLAPPRVKFFDRSWKPLTYLIPFDDNDKLVGDSELKRCLWECVFDITHISDEHIANFKPGVHQASDALRWMAKRQTTRDEDMAYCLIGLLGIPLTIAYGEGMQAFYRLQVEILQHTSDMGLFAWIGRPASKNSMLASEPKCFSSSVAIKSLVTNQILAINGRELHIKVMTYEVTNRTTSERSKEVALRIKGLPGSIPVVLQTWDDDGVGSQTLGADEVETQTSDDEDDTVDFQTSENADKVELAILGRIRQSKPKEYLAILLSTKNGQCKRLSTKEHIRLTLPEREQWPKPADRYIQ